METRTVEGGCFCGRVRYRAQGEPLTSTLCHCNTCRRLSAAPAVAWVTFPKERFAITQGEPAVLRSSATVQRRFCADCGSALTYENESVGDEIDVTTCSLDDPDAFAPTDHTWISHSLRWMRIADGLPAYAQSRHPGL